MQNTYLVEFEKYKNCPLPEVGVIWNHPREMTSKGKIQYRVLSYTDTHGEVETVHSGRVQSKTLHWIRKLFNSGIAG